MHAPRVLRPLALLLLTAVAAACGDGKGGSAPAPGERRWPGAEWEISTPAAEGMDAARLDAARAYAFQPERHSQGVVVVRNGAIVAEWYADGAGANSLATSWSMAKSMASTLVGIAIDRGEIPGLDVPLTDYYPAWLGADKAGVTLRDLLEMRSGILWSEGPGSAYLYANGSDQLAFALDRPQDRTPGSFWNYSSADSMLISGVIAAATGRDVREYAHEVLFEPIGMPAEWWIDAAGHALTYCCVDTTTREYARFGLLFARGGEWNGRQVVSRSWVEEATRPLDGAPFYGLQWWTNAGGAMTASAPSDAFSARGLHGQYVYVVPSLDLVVVRNGTYRRAGNGDAVRTGSNSHATQGPSDWDDESFLGPIVASIDDAGTATAGGLAAPAPDARREAARAAMEAAGVR